MDIQSNSNGIITVTTSQNSFTVKVEVEKDHFTVENGSFQIFTIGQNGVRPATQNRFSRNQLVGIANPEGYAYVQEQFMSGRTQSAGETASLSTRVYNILRTMEKADLGDSFAIMLNIPQEPTSAY